MQTDTLEIHPDIRAGLHALAEETHRGEADMLNEPLAAFLQRERQTIAHAQSSSYQSTQTLIDRIKARRESRDIGEFNIREAIEEGR
jgi:hypothetical protein